MHVWQIKHDMRIQCANAWEKLIVQCNWLIASWMYGTLCIKLIQQYYVQKHKLACAFSMACIVKNRDLCMNVAAELL